MFCSSCGAPTADGSAFCGKCGRPIVGYSVGGSVAAAAAASYAGAATGDPSVAVLPQAGARAYAGFWLRLVAHIIDEILIIAAIAILAVIVVAAIGFGNIRDQFEEMGRSAGQPNPVIPAFFLVMFLTFMACGIVAGWLYYAGMESSEYQGTLGKMALGLVVTDTGGSPVSFARASGRFFAKIITGLVPLLIGWIMAGFTEKKQALHDMIAGCLVLRKV